MLLWVCGRGSTGVPDRGGGLWDDVGLSFRLPSGPWQRRRPRRGCQARWRRRGRRGSASA
ncbi:unnamed protein product [Spirodela intermedia]|uniref:Uncharacterized protein n=1 Tax=Spirodela intermedia TaxID=51605 RepID=A0A7I8JZX1_SPIIN|nr:unnamed protein product [Spirodela intermedia]